MEENKDITGEIIELYDEDENLVKYRLFDVTEYKGKKYALLIPADADPDNCDVAIFGYDERAGVLTTIDDENLLEEVFEFYRSEQDDGDDTAD